MAWDKNGAVTTQVWDDWNLIQEHEQRRLPADVFPRRTSERDRGLLRAAVGRRLLFPGWTRERDASDWAIEQRDRALYLFRIGPADDSLSCQHSTLNFRRKQPLPVRRRAVRPGSGDVRHAQPLLSSQPRPLPPDRSHGFDAGDLNLFRYVGDDPVDKSDPEGLMENALGGWDGDGSHVSPVLSREQLNMGWVEEGKTSQPAGNANERFYADVRAVERTRGADVDPQTVGRAVVDDGHLAANETAQIAKPGHGFKSGDEVAYDRFVKGNSLERHGPTFSKNHSSGADTGLPDFRRTGPAPLTGAHGHSPISGSRGRLFQRVDERSADGHNIAGKPYISAVGWYRDPDGVVNIRANSHYYHSSDGRNFYPDQQQ